MGGSRERDRERDREREREKERERGQVRNITWFTTSVTIAVSWSPQSNAATQTCSWIVHTEYNKIILYCEVRVCHSN